MELEFEDNELTVKEYLDEEDEFIHARINTFIKLMAKKGHVKFADIINSSFADFQNNLKKFQEKYGLESKFNFLEK